MTEEKKDSSKQLTDAQKEDFQKISQAARVTKAPPPINPLDPKSSHLFFAAFASSVNQPPSPIVPITARELMERWSIDAITLIMLSYNGLLFPEYPQDFRGDAKWLLGTDQQTRDSYLSKCIYDRDVVDVAEILYREHLEAVRKKTLPDKNEEIAPAHSVSESNNDQGSTIDPDTFIRELRVGFINDTSVFIQPPGGKRKQFSCNQMGFKPSTKTWKMFITILEDSRHEYHAGIHSADRVREKNRNYNNAVRRICDFSKKFVSFLNQTYNTAIPNHFNVFENRHRKGGDRAGTYVPKFQIISLRITMSESEALNSIEDLSQRLRTEINEDAKGILCEQLKPIALYAYKKGGKQKLKSKTYYHQIIKRRNGGIILRTMP